MSDASTSSSSSGGGRGGPLRLLYPQWQGACSSSMRELASEFPLTWRAAATLLAPRSSRRSYRRTMAPRPSCRSLWETRGSSSSTVSKPRRFSSSS
jgi:hypothetical protein